jgi:hypothetical protein
MTNYAETAQVFMEDIRSKYKSGLLLEGLPRYQKLEEAKVHGTQLLNDHEAVLTHCSSEGEEFRNQGQSLRIELIALLLEIDEAMAPMNEK